MQSAYLKTMRPVFPGVSDHGLLQAGHSVCTLFDGGHDWVHVLAELLHGAGLQAGDSGKLIASAVATMCPQYLDLLPGGSKFGH